MKINPRLAGVLLFSEVNCPSVAHHPFLGRISRLRG